MLIDGSTFLRVSLALNLALIGYIAYLHFGPRAPLSDQVQELRELNKTTWDELEKVREVSR